MLPRILTYHRVGQPRGGRFERLTVRVERFERQVGLLRLLGYRPVDMDAVAQWVDGSPSPARRPVVLSFDDGFADVYDHAAPVLAGRGLPAVVYALTDRARADWMDWGGQEPPALLSRSQLRELADAGVQIGSHGRTHARLPGCSPSGLQDEVAGSRKALEDLLGREVAHFCYPFGFWDERVADAVRDAGYRTACTTKRGVVRRGSCVFCLPRLTIGKRMGTSRFLRRLLLGGLRCASSSS